MSSTRRSSYEYALRLRSSGLHSSSHVRTPSRACVRANLRARCCLVRVCVCARANRLAPRFCLASVCLRLSLSPFPRSTSPPPPVVLSRSPSRFYVSRTQSQSRFVPAGVRVVSGARRTPGRHIARIRVTRLGARRESWSKVVNVKANAIECIVRERRSTSRVCCAMRGSDRAAKHRYLDRNGDDHSGKCASCVLPKFR